jgi:FkbM family methyltransferase
MATIEDFIVSKDSGYPECHYKFLLNDKYKQVLVVDDGVLTAVIGKNAMKKTPDMLEYISTSAADIANGKFTSVTEGPDTYEKCLELFSVFNFNVIPIVSDTGYPVRFVHRYDYDELKMSNSFAQFGEDVVFKYVLLSVRDIFYIDIGAYDPWYDNVTKWISMSGGGHGINVEPQEFYYNRLKIDRPNDINLHTAVGDSEGVLEMYAFEGATTALKEYALTHYTPFSVQTTILAKICDTYVKPEQPIHFLKIDVEGYEKQVLSGADFKKYRPWIVMLEATIPSTETIRICDEPTYDEWEDILFANGYCFAKQYGINRFYLANEHEDLLERFGNINDMAKVLGLDKTFEL